MLTIRKVKLTQYILIKVFPTACYNFFLSLWQHIAIYLSIHFCTFQRLGTVCQPIQDASIWTGVKQGILDKSYNVRSTVVMQENNFASFNPYFWFSLQQYIVKFVHLISADIYSNRLVRYYQPVISPCWFHHMHSKTLWPRIFGFGVDVDGSPGVIHDFCRFKLP